MNDELLTLYTAGREERVDQPRMGTPEYTAMRERDRQWRLRTAAILATLLTPEAADLYHAALLFEHGDEPEDAWRAYELAREAAQQGEERTRWPTAAAYDRWCMYQSKPQKYGTQAGRIQLSASGYYYRCSSWVIWCGGRIPRCTVARCTFWLSTNSCCGWTSDVSVVPRDARCLDWSVLIRHSFYRPSCNGFPASILSICPSGCATSFG